MIFMDISIHSIFSSETLSLIWLIIKTIIIIALLIGSVANVTVLYQGF